MAALGLCWPLGAVLAAAVALALAPEREVSLTVRLDLKAAILISVAMVIAASLLSDAIRSAQSKQGEPPAQPEPVVEEPLDAAAAAAAAEKARQEAEAEAAALAEAMSTEQLMKALRAWRTGSDVLDGEAESRENEQKAIQQIWHSMDGASPVVLHRFSADEVDNQMTHSATPPFMACGHLWSLKMGPIGTSAPEMRFFCVLPHGHTDRMRFSLFFAREPGKGFRERLVIDWPPDLAGHPWGPTLSGQELEEYRQADGSVLVMLHALGLGGSECQQGS